jgi:hypothetical protein
MIALVLLLVIVSLGVGFFAVRAIWSDYKVRHPAAEGTGWHLVGRLALTGPLGLLSYRLRLVVLCVLMGVLAVLAVLANMVRYCQW